jgi:hypothetical protein
MKTILKHVKNQYGTCIKNLFGIAEIKVFMCPAPAYVSIQ